MLNKKVLLIVLLLLSVFLLSSCEKKFIEYTPKSLGIDEYMDTKNSKVYYEIFVGGFSDSNNDGIGDIKGLINRLDYLNDGDDNSGKSLGINGIWLMPIMSSTSYHKYDVVDYFKIDSNYGDMDDFKLLVKEAKNRNIDIIIDLVLNHTSNFNDWFKKMKDARSKNNTTNKYYDYYVVVDEKDRESGKVYEKLVNNWYYECNFSTSMPELNLDNLDVRKEIENIVKYYLVDIGVQGFRLDAVKYFYLYEDTKCIEFLKWFKNLCKSYKSDVYIVGENWSSDESIIRYYEAINCFNFSMSESLGNITQTAKNVNSVENYISSIISFNNNVKAKNPESTLVPFISNHDQDRSAGYLSNADGEIKMAANLYLLSPGTPFIYYGEEIGMKGSRGTEQTDANRRLAMLWGDNDKVKDPVGSTYKKSNQTNGTVKQQLNDKDSLYNHYKKLISIRKSCPEIAIGDYKLLSFDLFNFAGFEATYNNSKTYVFHNTSYFTTQEVNVGELGSLFAVIGCNEATYKDGIIKIGPMTTIIIK